MKKIILLLCLSIWGAIATLSNAQVSSYTFTSNTGTYTEIATSSNVLGTIANDEEVFNNSTAGAYAPITNTGFSIGFNFVYNGVTYDKFAVGTNGFIVLGTGSFTINNLTAGIIGTATTAGYANLITGCNMDLQGQTGSVLNYLIAGSPGSRTLTIQWKGYKVYNASGTAINFQIVLTETTNTVSINYGTMTNNTSTGVQVGLRGINNTDFNVRTTTSNWAATTAGLSNTSTCTFSNTIFPASGLSFTFNPPAACVAPPAGGTTQSTATTGCPGTAFTLSVTGDGTGSGLTYQWQSSLDNSTWLDITGATGATYTFTNGITVSTYFRRRITCSNQTANSVSLQYTVNGSVAYATLPFTETFENTWSNSACGTRDIPTSNWRNTPATGDNSWRRDDDASGASWTNSSIGAYSPTGAASSLRSARYHSRSTSLNGIFDLFVNCNSGNASKELKFDYINSNGVDSLTILLSTDGGLSFTQIGNKLGVSIANTWSNRVYSFTSSSATTIIRFLANGDFGTSDIGIDNVNVYSVNCGMVASASFSNIAATAATANWAAVSGASAYNWEVRTSGTPGTAGAVTTGSSNTTSANIIGLAGSITYSFYIQTDCGSGNIASWAGPFTFTTTPANDDCSNAVTLTSGASAVTGSCIGATQSAAPTAACTSSNSALDVWYKFVAAGSRATVTVVGAGSFDAIVQCFDACTGGTSVGCVDASAANGTETLTLTGLIPGNTYNVRVFQYTGTSITSVPAGSSFTIALSIPTISSGTANSCASVSGPFISSTNNNTWVAVNDFSGNIVAEINAQGNNLGSVSAKLYVNTGAVRQSGNGIYYLNRNIELTPTTQPSTPVKVRLYFLQSELAALQAQAGSGVTGLNDIVVTKNASPCQATVSGVGTLVTPNNRSTYLSNGNVVEITISSFSSFYFSGGTIALPVVLQQINAERNGAKNIVKWTTTSEQNSKGFFIERSADGVGFSAIDFVQSLAINGNSTTNLTYYYSDEQVLKGDAYYRLKMVDKDGKVTYSSIVVVKAKAVSSLQLVGLFPNPTKEWLTVSVSTPTDQVSSIIVTDMTGKAIMQLSKTLVKGSNTFTINVSKLVAGNYIVKLINNNANEHASQRFLKQ
jgi:hypothetical protein